MEVVNVAEGPLDRKAAITAVVAAVSSISMAAVAAEAVYELKVE
jgi:hypothetical protein